MNRFQSSDSSETGKLWSVEYIRDHATPSSIRNRINELEVHINNEELDIIAVTETWLTEDVLDSEYYLSLALLYIVNIDLT